MEDPSMNPQAPSEADTHVAHLANTTPLTHVPIHDHPPYPEMILGAISALKERDGSSKRAISKYIENGCPNLPPAHSTLLTHHLKLLKNNGQVIMVKHSYKLPGSAATSPTPNTNEAHTAAPASSAGPKRGRGRPLRRTVGAIAASLSNPNKANTTAVASSNGSKRGRGRPPKPQVAVVVQPSGENGLDAVLFSLGLVSGHGNLVERSRGRPKRPKVIEAGSAGQTMARKGPGRPLKPKTLTDGMVSLERKRRPGRPPKAWTSAASAALSGKVGRPRGRPQKGISAQVKPPSRPPKKAQLVPFAGDGGGAVGVPKPKNPRKLTGKPLGRPRKNASWAMVESTDSQYMMDYQVLKTKYEQIQLKVLQSVSLIKPHLNSQTPDSIVRAVEEMEVLSRTDATAPINAQVQ